MTIVAVAMFGLGVYLGLDAWWSGSLWRYRLAGYCVAVLLSLPLATRLVFGRRLDRFWRRAVFASVPLLFSTGIIFFIYFCTHSICRLV